MQLIAFIQTQVLYQAESPTNRKFRNFLLCYFVLLISLIRILLAEKAGLKYVKMEKVE